MSIFNNINSLDLEYIGKIANVIIVIIRFIL